MNPKVEWQWPAVVTYVVALAVIGGLVFVDKVHAEILLAFLTWLMPGPYQQKQPPPPTTTTTVAPASSASDAPVVTTVTTAAEPPKDAPK